MSNEIGRNDKKQFIAYDQSYILVHTHVRVQYLIREVLFKRITRLFSQIDIFDEMCV